MKVKLIVPLVVLALGAASSLKPQADGTLPDLGLGYGAERLAHRNEWVEGERSVSWSVGAGEEAVMALVVRRPVTKGQENFVRVNVSVDASDQAGRAMRGDAHIVSFDDSVRGRVSFFHWAYTDVGGDGTCWVRVHATDNASHPCSTSHVRKHPKLYPLLYPDRYPTGPPGPLNQQLQCDMSEFSHVDPGKALGYAAFMDADGGTPLCVQLRVRLRPASADRASAEVQAFLWHNGSARALSNFVSTQINGFFQFADVRDPTAEDFPVSALFLRRLRFALSAVGAPEDPVLRLGSDCAQALQEAAEGGELRDSPEKGDAAPLPRPVAPSPLGAIPHPPPEVCFPDFSQQAMEMHKNYYRMSLRRVRVESAGSLLKVPRPFAMMGASKSNHPLSYNFFNTYRSNISKFYTIAFQEPTFLYAEGRDTHLTGPARVERIDADGQYRVHVVPYTLAFLMGHMVRPHVVAFKDDHFSIIMYVRSEYEYRKTKCFCGLEGEVVDACLEDDCEDEFGAPEPIRLQKVAGLVPLRECCTTRNCLDENFDWDACRL